MLRRPTERESCLNSFGRCIVYARTAEEFDVIQGLEDRKVEPLLAYIDKHKSLPESIASAIAILFRSDGDDIQSQLVLRKHPQSTSRKTESLQFSAALDDIEVAEYIEQQMAGGETYEVAVEMATEWFAKSKSSIERAAPAGLRANLRATRLKLEAARNPTSPVNLNNKNSSEGDPAGNEDN